METAIEIRIQKSMIEDEDLLNSILVLPISIGYCIIGRPDRY